MHALYLAAVIALCSILCTYGVSAQPPSPVTPCPFVNDTGVCPRCNFWNPSQAKLKQDELDDCYVIEATRFAVFNGGAARPFGAVIVDPRTNQVLCYGRNNFSNFMHHAERQAIDNCTSLYGSGAAGDRVAPNTPWVNVTLYASAEPCPMCTTASIFRKIGRIVFGIKSTKMMQFGFTQFTISSEDFVAKYAQEFLLTIGNGFLPKYGRAGVAYAEAAFEAGSGVLSTRQRTIYDDLEKTEADPTDHSEACGCGNH
jgi:tRNA(Arg) A34 adenosine deaminase TadA